MQDSYSETTLSTELSQKVELKEMERTKTNHKVDLLKSEFEKFEKGQVNADEFRDFIINDIGIVPNEKIEKILRAPQPDGKNFTTIVTNLDILKKKDGTIIKEKRNPDYSTKYSRYRKVLDTPKSLEQEDDPMNGIKTKTHLLLKRTITADEFRSTLKSFGINPMVEGINKVVRDYESGKFVTFTDLYGAVIKHRSDKFDPTKVSFEIKTKKFYDESGSEETSDMMFSSGNGTGQMQHGTKKKLIQTKCNFYNSNKDLFDWELSETKKIKAGEFNPKIMDKNDKKVKNLFDSKIFDNAPNDIKKSKPSAAFESSSNFMTWSGKSESKIDEKSEIKRRNPNQTFLNNEEERKPNKINKMQMSSQESVLNDLNKVKAKN